MPTERVDNDLVRDKPCYRRILGETGLTKSEQSAAGPVFSGVFRLLDGDSYS